MASRMITALVLVLLMQVIVAYKITLDCETHCGICKDQVVEDCEMNAYLISDGDICHCCDQCGYKRSSGQSCQEKVIMKQIGDDVAISLVPLKCELGYKCVSDHCAEAEAGFCTLVVADSNITYSCDESGLFLPVECSEYHCWCINPITGSPVRNTKVPKPMNPKTCPTVIL